MVSNSCNPSSFGRLSKHQPIVGNSDLQDFVKTVDTYKVYKGQLAIFLKHKKMKDKAVWLKSLYPNFVCTCVCMSVSVEILFLYTECTADHSSPFHPSIWQITMGPELVDIHLMFHIQMMMTQI